MPPAHSSLLGYTFCTLWLSTACAQPSSTARASAESPAAPRPLTYPQEKHLRAVRQLTFGGNNAEGYFDFTGRYIVFQSDWDAINPQGCDQIFLLDLLDSLPKYRLISTGKGRTTCSYFLRDGRIIYASTHAISEACPPPPTYKGRYVWPLYEYDLYVYDPRTDSLQAFLPAKGYDAEATVSPDGRYLVFTSQRSGDLELWVYDFATQTLRQVTQELGYDGGAFFGPDSKTLVWRASRPQGAAAESYKALLAQGLVEPTNLHIFVMHIDSLIPHQVTHLPGANWAPFFHPNGRTIVFSSNHHSLEKGGRRFNIFAIQRDGTGLRQITFDPEFDAFPMFSPDGKKFIWASNRAGQKPRETNLFIADWVE
jgi:WD40 repeat protein